MLVGASQLCKSIIFTSVETLALARLYTLHPTPYTLPPTPRPKNKSDGKYSRTQCCLGDRDYIKKPGFSTKPESL